MIFSVSCETETIIESTESTHKLKFNFNEDSNKSNNQDFLLEGTIIKNGSKLTLVSEELEMTKTINQETGLESYIIYKKETNSLKSGGGPRIVPGYFYDGNDCWIRGTWYHGDNGQSLFIPGSAATQYLNNICGWSNVA